MKNIRNIFVFLTLTSLFSCIDRNDNISHTKTQINITYPGDVNDMQIEKDSIMLRNISTGQTTVWYARNIDLPSGLYDCSYLADVTYKNGTGADAVFSRGHLAGKVENMQITGEEKNIDIETFLSADNDDFIFEEIFFTGTLRASGSQYYGDSYIKIYNNTDHVLYADGLGFCESKFKSTLFFDYKPDIRRDTFTVWSLYVIPGTGRDHPVLPGHSLLIVDTGIDHRLANPNSLDFSKADFEWYDVLIIKANLDI